MESHPLDSRLLTLDSRLLTLEQTIKPKNMKKSTYLPMLLIFLVTNLLTAQENFLDDSDFFQKQAKIYQQWLDASGLGKILKVHSLEVAEKELSLYLGFYTEDEDVCWAQWEQLKLDFAQDKDISLEQQLFYKMIHLMEVRQSLANVQLYNTYDLSQEPCFFVGIFFEGGKVQTEENKCRASSRTLAVEPNELDLQKDSDEEFKQRFSKEKVFDAIYDWAQKRFVDTSCEQRFPELNLQENGDNLRFIVRDLCKEVLRDETDSYICKILRKIKTKYTCNWIKREKLSFTFTYQTTTQGFKIGITVDGRYGSGYYKEVGRDGYHDMDIDFKEYLEEYADGIREEVREIFK